MAILPCHSPNEPRIHFNTTVMHALGVVQLSSFVDSRQAATRAVELSGSVKGVKSVENSLIVK